MNFDVWKHFLALMGVFFVTLGLAGCNQEAEVPTAGEGPKNASEEGSFTEVNAPAETKSDEDNKTEALDDDTTEDEGGSILE